ncbi:MAG: PAS domain-containing protein [Methyloceanibacter sp.]|uniref:PAS domain-containing protein n=1 Tax=Methyloceanibacter sp. TaxID=1965321 RepID=UPI003D9B7398
MKTAKDYADRAVAALARLLPPGTDETKVAAIIDEALAASARERDEQLSQLLDASPAVIYSFKARDDYAPIFVSENIKRLLGYRPDEYLKDADFWRSRVHPDTSCRSRPNRRCCSSKIIMRRNTASARRTAPFAG